MEVEAQEGYEISSKRRREPVPMGEETQVWCGPGYWLSGGRASLFGGWALVSCDTTIQACTLGH